MNSKIIYELSEEDFQSAIEKVLSSHIEKKIYNKFESVIIDSKTACHILQISMPTLRKYILAGELWPEPKSTNDKILFRLSDILKADVSEIKKKLRYANT